MYVQLISEYTGCTEEGLKIAEVEQNFPSHYSFFSQVTPKGKKKVVGKLLVLKHRSKNRVEIKISTMLTNY